MTERELLYEILKELKQHTILFGKMADGIFEWMESDKKHHKEEEGTLKIVQKAIKARK